jgi:hypothetical protein
MAKDLESTKQQKRHEIANVEAVSSRVKAGVHRYWALPKSIAERIDGGGVVDQATSIEIFEDVGGTHRGSLSPVSAA